MNKFFEDQAQGLSDCFVAQHTVEDVAHIDHEEFVFLCRTCDKVYAVLSERVFLIEDE